MYINRQLTIRWPVELFDSNAHVCMAYTIPNTNMFILISYTYAHDVHVCLSESS